MLAAVNRMSCRDEFQRTVRRGRRAAGRNLVAHLDTGQSAAPRVGFAVGRTVGPAHLRNLVRRRLRSSMAARLSRLPEGSLLVIRATPAAAAASYGALDAELERLLRRVLVPERVPGRR